MPVKSPCIGICRLNPEDSLCIGCWRSLEEIAAWSKMEDSQRREVLATIIKRQEERNWKNKSPLSS